MSTATKFNDQNELVNIEVLGGIETVNARDLHKALESGKDFSGWVKARIKNYGFIEGVDFTTIWWKSTGGRPAIEYYVSIDMAKHISMIENTDKGREVRLWFIERDKQLSKIEQIGPEQFEFGIIPDAPNDGSHLSLRAFCRVRKYDYTDAELSRMGRELRVFCEERGFSVGKIDDPTYVKVRTYPIAILEDYFA